MTLLQHGGLGLSCVVGDVPDARFGTELLDRRDKSWPSAPGHPRHLLIPDHGSDVDHFSDLPSDGSVRPCREFLGTCIENVNFLCKELA
jgi:hypothetical protein